MTNQSDPLKSSYGENITDTFAALGELFKSEILLIGIQIKESIQNIEKHLVQLIVLVGLLIIAATPIIYAAAWGLGILLNNQFWLSSLIIGVFGTSIVGFLIVRTLKKIREYFKLEVAQKSLQNSSEILLNKIGQLKHAVTGTSL